MASLSGDSLSSAASAMLSAWRPAPPFLKNGLLAGYSCTSNPEGVPIYTLLLLPILKISARYILEVSKYPLGETFNVAAP